MYAHSLQLNALNDEDLMEHLQGGYDCAFRILTERYQDRIHNFIYRYTHNTQDSEDLVQETFLRVYRCRHSYARIAKFSTWLYTIALNLVKTHYKKSKRMQLVSIDGSSGEHDNEPITFDLKGDGSCPEMDTSNSMFLNDVEKALMQLPDDFRQIVIMRDIQSLTYDEIMDITGLPMGTVKSRINRGRVKLQELLRFYKNS